ncbi:hypothetical protein LTR37_007938 [Vermiconidia calcicola]|uniref:Uncharacterized protein n=1 Tax=Vermiconidia calcicola TaxID=1690605 RepID=A0ACC3NBU2_9PEZI|nr:hypothetical protein LTR37_007938 [Vermiconidia calcicola]
MRPAASQHLESLKPHVTSGVVPFGGATLDEPVKEGEGMKSNGSCMVICADTQEEAMDVVKSDTYYASGVWDLSKMQIYPFKCAVRNAL